MILTEPLRLTEHRRGLRRRRHARRRRRHRPGRRPAPRHRPGAHRARPRAARRAQEGRLPHPRRPREGIQEVRPQEGPQGAAVLQALSRGTLGRSRCGTMTACRFGTDGVRGRGQRRADRRDGARPRARRGRRARRRRGRRRPRHPRSRARCSKPRCRAGSGARGRRRRRCSASCPTPAVAVGRAPRRRARRDDLGLAQPVRRQRHQVLRPRRPQADRRRAGRRRGRARPRCSTAAAHGGADRRRGRPIVADADARSTRYARRASIGALEGRRLDGLRGRGRLRQRRGVDGRARRAAPRSAPTSTVLARRARRAQHQRRLRLDPPRGAAGARSSPRGADVGLAFDGDADRVLAVDARRARSSTATSSSPSAPSTCTARGVLADDTVVVTVMTNLGFRLAMAAHGIDGGRDRGRRPLRARGARPTAGYALGGEQSGHVIFRDLATTGDGLLTGGAAARPACAGPAGRSPSWPPRP